MDNNRNPIYDMLDCREISTKNSNGRGCAQKCLLQKTSFGQTILEQPLPKNLKAEISIQYYAYSYIGFLSFIKNHKYLIYFSYDFFYSIP